MFLREYEIQNEMQSITAQQRGHRESANVEYNSMNLNEAVRHYLSESVAGRNDFEKLISTNAQLIEKLEQTHEHNIKLTQQSQQ